MLFEAKTTPPILPDSAKIFLTTTDFLLSPTPKSASSILNSFSPDWILIEFVAPYPNVEFLKPTFSLW